MSAEEDWRIDVDASEYFLHQQKRDNLTQRRPVIRKAHELVGPGINASAVRLLDFNDPLATYNGYYSSAPGAANAPNAEDVFIGIVTMDGELGGWQRFRSLDTDDVYDRSFTRHPLDAEVLFWGAWALQSGAGAPHSHPNITVSATAPPTPAVNDLWVDI